MKPVVTRLLRMACACGAVLDAATAAGEPDATPSPGDWTICWYCGAIYEFGERLVLMPRTLAEVPEKERKTAALFQRMAFARKPS